MHSIHSVLIVFETFVVFTVSENNAMEGHFHFSAVHNANGTAMCALLEPTETLSVRSQLECSSRCKENDKCAGFNYKKHTQQQRTTCETFNSPTRLDGIENCAYFELHGIVATSSLIQAVDNPLLIQRNANGSNFFNRTWEEFKVGFSDSNGNYWLGNELLHQLTMNNTYKLRFDLQSRDNNSLWFWAEYNTFTVGSETTNYTLQVGGFTGNVSSDAFTYCNGMMFTTKDRDNDLHSVVNCAQATGGGFWYKSCAYCSINTVWGSTFDNFRWYQLTSGYQYLQTSRMWLV